jgi:hypothetical protein
MINVPMNLEDTISKKGDQLRRIFHEIKVGAVFFKQANMTMLTELVSSRRRRPLMIIKGNVNPDKLRKLIFRIKG